jgi:hypothetical protein
VELMNIHVELPCGAVSRGYEREDSDKALATFDQVVAQIREFKNFIADVVLVDGRTEIQREHIENVTA